MTNTFKIATTDKNTILIYADVYMVPLAAEELAYLNKPVKGKGGFQNFMRKLQGRIIGEVLCLDVDNLQKLVQYSRRGQGGFQYRMKSLGQRAADVLENSNPAAAN